MQPSEALWIRNYRIVRLERCADAAEPTYAVHVEHDVVGYVRECGRSDWAFETLDGRLAPGYPTARSAANQLVDVFDRGGWEASRRPAESRFGHFAGSRAARI